MSLREESSIDRGLSDLNSDHLRGLGTKKFTAIIVNLLSYSKKGGYCHREHARRLLK
jgi:hypothetical protein